MEKASKKTISFSNNLLGYDLHPSVWVFGLAVLNGDKLVEEFLGQGASLAV